MLKSFDDVAPGFEFELGRSAPLQAEAMVGKIGTIMNSSLDPIFYSKRDVGKTNTEAKADLALIFLIDECRTFRRKVAILFSLFLLQNENSSS